jgi:hypothetical protein
VGFNLYSRYCRKTLKTDPGAIWIRSCKGDRDAIAACKTFLSDYVENSVFPKFINPLVIRAKHTSHDIIAPFETGVEFRVVVKECFHLSLLNLSNIVGALPQPPSPSSSQCTSGIMNMIESSSCWTSNKNNQDSNKSEPVSFC